MSGDMLGLRKGPMPEQCSVLMPSPGCWARGGRARTEPFPTCPLLPGLKELWWQGQDEAVHCSGLCSVTSRFCFPTGQPCSHYREHRLAGTRALCKSPGFVSILFNKSCIFLAHRCPKGPSKVAEEPGICAKTPQHIPAPNLAGAMLSRAMAASS